MGTLRVRLLIMEGGERLPLLMSGDGTPLFLPTVWSVSERRLANVASATMLADLVALKLLYLWAEGQSISLEERMLVGHYLSPGELRSLVKIVRSPINGGEGTVQPTVTSFKTMSLERHRQRSPAPAPEVSPQTAAGRLRTIANYLRWLTQEGMTHSPEREVAERIKSRDAMLSSLLAQMPKGKGRNIVGHREGPAEEILARLLTAVEIDAAENPWKDPGLRARNQLLIHIIFGLGVRRGEALGIKITNIDFRRNTVLIARDADDPEDIRCHQPLTKTRDRLLPMKDTLAAMVQEYVTHVRAKFPQARRHPFLFVSHQGGAPLALVSVNKVFRTLREKVEGLPENLSPHLLRHAWNDAFSAILDKRRVPQSQEEKVRSYLMGWSPTSKTAGTYTRRHVREKAEEMSLEHQACLTKVSNNEES